MLFTRERTRPCMARLWRSSSGRSTSSSAPSWRMVMVPGISRSSEPLGPLTVTWRSATVTSTPLGTGTGAFPIRDMGALLPDEAQDFAAHVALARFAVGHETLAGRDDGNTEPTEDAGDLLSRLVHPETGLGHA